MTTERERVIFQRYTGIIDGRQSRKSERVDPLSRPANTSTLSTFRFYTFAVAREMRAIDQATETSVKILMVLTSHDQLGNTGRKTGFWLEEFAAPYC